MKTTGSTTRKGIIILLAVVLPLLVLSACGSPAPASTEAPIATEAPVVTSTPIASSAFEPVANNVTVMVPAGRTNWQAFAIMPIRDSGFNFYGNAFEEKGIHIPTSSGYALEGRTQDIAIEVEATVPQGVYYGTATLQDDSRVKQVFTITLNVVGPCDFTIPASSLPETFVTMENGEIKDIVIGNSRIHVECINQYPVYTIADPDVDCLSDTIEYSPDGTWGCYLPSQMWVAQLGGRWLAPYGQPSGWIAPDPDVDSLFPPDWLTPIAPQLPSQQG